MQHKFIYFFPVSFNLLMSVVASFSCMLYLIFSWGTCKNVHFSVSFPFFFKQLQVGSKSEDLRE